MSSLRWVVVLFGVVLAVSLVVPVVPVLSQSPDSESRSEQVYPPQQLPLNFSHRRHLEQGAQCQLCHASTSTSTSATDDNLPGHTTCGICHQM